VAISGFYLPGALGLEGGGVDGGLGLGAGVEPLLPELWLLPEFVEVGLGLLVVEGMGNS